MPKKYEGTRSYLVWLLRHAIVELEAGQVQAAIDTIDGWRENVSKLPLNVGPACAADAYSIEQRLAALENAVAELIAKGLS